MPENLQVEIIEIVDQFVLMLTSENPIVTLFVLLGYATLLISGVVYLKEHFRYKTVVATQKEAFRAIVGAGRGPD